MGLFSDGERGLAIVASNAPEKKINYRSVGRGSGGVEMTARRRYSWRDPDFVSQPSIPGKFETVLYRGNNEDKGFGSQAPRFGQEDRQSELPGPADHKVPSSIASQGIAEQNVGKRGHGAFASRTPRQKPPKSAQAPGPGDYKAPSGLTAPASARSSSVPSASFVPPSSVNPAKFNERPAPGPGDYSGAVGPYTEKAKTVDSVGACMSRKGELPYRVPLQKVETPGPGAYHNSAPAEVAQGPSGSTLPARQSWRPPKGWGPEKPLSESALVRASAQVLAEESALSRDCPGPGQYDPKTDAVTGGGKTSFSSGESQMFKVGNSHMPRKWPEQTPGPGQYDALPSPRRGVTSMASGSMRFRGKESQAPGPAYYAPPKQPEYEFHLNPQQKWV